MTWKCAICFSLLAEENKDCSCTPCGHVFHSECLTRWFSSKGSSARSCPECRADVCRPIKLYPSSDSDYQSFNKEEIEKEVSSLKAQLDDLNSKAANATATFNSEKTKAEILLQTTKFEKMNVEILLHAANCERRKYDILLQEETFKKMKVKTELQLANFQLEKMRELQEQILQLNSALARSTAELTFHKNTHAMVHGDPQEVEQILQGIQVNVCSQNSADILDSVKQLAIFCSILKRELCNTVAANINLKDKLMMFRTEFMVTHQNFNK